MATRILSGTIRNAHGDPWADFELQFVVSPSTFTDDAHYPTSAIAVTTDDAGAFSVELVVGVAYEVRLLSAFEQRGAVTIFPDGTIFRIAIPEGSGPLDLAELRASGSGQPATPSVMTLIERRGLPSGGTTGQVLVKASGDDFDTAWSTAPGGGTPTWGSIDGTLTDQADLVSALAGKADAQHGHEIAEIDGLDDALAAKADTAALATKADVGHTHTTSDVSGLDTVLAGKANVGHTHATTDITGLGDALAAKADAAALAGKADAVHTHATSDVSGLDDALAGKADALALSSHVSDTNNPHGVTADQIGAASVTDLARLTAVTRASGFRTALHQTVFDTTAGDDWYGWGSTPGTNYHDSSDGILAGTHISVTLPANEATVEAIRREELDINLEDNLLLIYVRVDNPQNIDRIRVFCLSTPPSGDYYRKDYYLDGTGDSAILGTDWQILTVDPLDGRDRGTTGSPDMSSVKGLRIDVVSHGQGATGTLRIGGFALAPRAVAAFPNGVASITFDDGWDDCWIDLRPIMAAYDVRPTLYVIQDQIGAANRLTMPQLRHLHDLLGWEIGFHSTTAAVHNATWVGMTESQLHAEFNAGQEWFLSNGFGVADTLSYPSGAYNADVVDVAATYFRAARSTLPMPSGQSIAIPPGISRFRLNSRSLQNDISGWGATYVDPVRESGGWFIMHGHNIGPTAGSGTVTPADLDALVAYIVGEGIPILPVGEVLSILAQPAV